MEFPYDYTQFTTVFTRVVGVLTALGLDLAEQMMGRKAQPDELQPTIWAARALAADVSGIQHALDVETLRHIGRAICMTVSGYDAVITPTTPVSAPAIGDPGQGGDDIEAYFHTLSGQMAFAGPINVAGLPAISLPLGIAANGMPLGAQFIGNRAREDLLIRLAAQLEAACPWKQRRPNLAA